MSEAVVKVLLIEDDPGDAELVTRALAECHRCFATSHETTLANGIERLQSQEFDVVLLDLSLPDSFGVPGVGRLCRDFPDAPVVVLTGLEDDQLALEVLDVGAQDFLIKDMTSGEQLERTLRYAIQRHQIQQENRRLLGELERMARFDGLTDVLNRRSFSAELQQHWSHSIADNSALSCIVLDIDYFKSVNDTFGHAMGDEVLKCLAKLIDEICEVNQVVARYGGEEFAILLANTSEEEASAWAENVRLKIEQQEIYCQSEKLDITASFGVAQRLNDTAGPDQLVDLADQALLVAKQLGRNQVVTFSEMSQLGDGDITASDILHQVPARDIMTPLLFYLRQENPIARAVEILLRTRFDSLPVLDDDGRLVGLVSEEDLTSRLLTTPDWNGPISDVMNRKTVCFSEGTSVFTICEFLNRAAVSRVLIVQEGVPTGVIDRAILLRWYRNTRRLDDTETTQADVFCTVERLEKEVGRLNSELNGEPTAPKVINAATRMQRLIDETLAHFGSARATELASSRLGVESSGQGDPGSPES